LLLVNPDSWLERWLPLISQKAGADPVFEIGCGSGDDTVTLAAAGLDIIAIDLSADGVVQTRQRVSQARIEHRDVRDSFPVGESSLGVVVASLSLHYFPWSETLAIVARINAVLRPGGVFVCRVNSSEDHNYGATGHESIEAGYYRVNGEPKRFFDRAAVDRLFTEGWNCLSREQYTTNKYPMPKVVWEVVLEKAAAI
jgi:SAM-dependent methyltransferase